MPVGNYRKMQRLNYAALMAHFPRLQPSLRAPRVWVPNAEPFFLAIEERRVAATLKRLSLTGGFAVLSEPLREHTLAEITLETRIGRVTALVEVLPPARSDSEVGQAFRFVALDDIDQRRLTQILIFMQQQGWGYKEPRR